MKQDLTLFSVYPFFWLVCKGTTTFKENVKVIMNVIILISTNPIVVFRSLTFLSCLIVLNLLYWFLQVKQTCSISVFFILLFCHDYKVEGIAVQWHINFYVCKCLFGEEEDFPTQFSIVVGQCWCCQIRRNIYWGKVASCENVCGFIPGDQRKISILIWNTNSFLMVDLPAPHSVFSLAVWFFPLKLARRGGILWNLWEWHFVDGYLLWHKATGTKLSYIHRILCSISPWELFFFLVCVCSCVFLEHSMKMYVGKSHTIIIQRQQDWNKHY